MFTKRLSVKFDFIVKYAALFLLIFVPLYPKFPLFKVGGTFVSIRLEDLFLAVSAIIVLPLVKRDFNLWRKDKTSISLALYLIIGLISVLSAVFITKTADLQIGVLHLVRRLEYFMPFFIGFYAIARDKKNLDLFMKVIVFVIFVAFLYGLGQKYLYWPIIITQNQEYSKGVALRYREGSHINSTFAGHYDLASFLVLLMPIVIALLLILKKDGKLKFQLSTVFLGGLWLLVNSASRISFVTYLISTTLTLLIINKKRFIPIIVVISLLFSFSSQNMIARYQRVFDVARNKLLLSYQNVLVVNAQDLNPVKNIAPSPTPVAVEILEDRSTNIRLNVEWPRAIRAFLKNPLLGTGFSSITLATDNDYLRALGETGALGFIAFITIIINLVLTLIKLLGCIVKKLFTISETAFVAGIAGSMIGILINAVFIDIFEASKFAIIFWMLMGMLKGLEKNYEKHL